MCYGREAGFSGCLALKGVNVLAAQAFELAPLKSVVISVGSNPYLAIAAALITSVHTI